MKAHWHHGLYLVTHRGMLDEQKFLGIIDEAIAGGVAIVQLREKLVDPGTSYKTGKALKEMLKARNIPLIVNDSIELAKAIHADGVHLGQSDAPIEQARRELGENAILGLSLNTIDDAQAPEAHSADYLAASPVFPSSTKLDTTEPLGLTGLRTLRKHISQEKPLFAIGGIDEGNAQAVLDAGASGLAVISAIFTSKTPQATAKRLSTIIDQYHANNKTL
ncbi:MAG TPA: thiamine phosphate synthase [Opitutae bacterium]|nr:thiamine phosphate synthase [Opitutae bacterium]|tara:strand:+ start:638 stop:1297 length:660 start_codon:yes stop_codon:yes gene_type:complete